MRASSVVVHVVPEAIDVFATTLRLRCDQPREIPASPKEIRGSLNGRRGGQEIDKGKGAGEMRWSL